MVIRYHAVGRIWIKVIDSEWQCHTIYLSPESKPKKDKRAGRKQVTLDAPIHSRAKVAAKQRGIDLQQLVNEAVILNIEKSEFLRQYRPNFSYSMTEHGLFIKDAKDENPQAAQVVIKDGKIFCWLDNSDDCKHVHFALAIPEVAKLGLRKI